MPEDSAVLSCVYKIGGKNNSKKVGKKFGYYKIIPYLCTQKLKTQEEMNKKTPRERDVSPG